MFARVITFEGVSGADRAVGDRFFQQVFLPLAVTTAGFEGAYPLVDSGRVVSVSITLWSSREALKASDVSARKFLAHYTAVWGRTPTVETFEVAHAHLQAGVARPG